MLRLGIDEVGRGVLAGPLVVSGVLVDTDREIPDYWKRLRDSKKTSEKSRSILAAAIHEDVNVRTITVSVPAWLVDEWRLTYAMQKAVEEICKRLSADEIIIDGSDGFGLGRAMIKAEDRVKEVAAASIIAKVSRDHYMSTIPDPGYGFAENKGYGTATHIEALNKIGPCEEHRRLVSWIGERWPRK